MTKQSDLCLDDMNDMVDEINHRLHASGAPYVFSVGSEKDRASVGMRGSTDDIITLSVSVIIDVLVANGVDMCHAQEAASEINDAVQSAVSKSGGATMN